MKKLLFILFLFLSGFVSGQNVRAYTVEAFQRLEAKRAFVIGGDSLFNTTQLSSEDTTLVTLGHLQTNLNTLGVGFIDGRVTGRNIDITLPNYVPDDGYMLYILPDLDIDYGSAITLSINGLNPLQIHEYYSHDQNYSLAIVYFSQRWFVLIGIGDLPRSFITGINTGDQDLSGIQDSLKAIYNLEGSVTNLTISGNSTEINVNSSNGTGFKIKSGLNFNFSGISPTEFYVNAAGGGGEMVFPANGIGLSDGTKWLGSITNNSAQWNESYSWGNHATFGYITTESDPIFSAHTTKNIINGTGYLKNNNGIWTYDNSSYSLYNHNHSGVYEPLFSAGTTAQYRRGDKTWQTLNTTAVTEGTNQYYTNTRARLAISLTTVGSSGAATYNNSTGVLNIPSYTGGTTTGDNVYINGTDVSNPDLIGSSEISITNTITNKHEFTLNWGSVYEHHLNILNSALDNYVLGWDAFTGKFEWVPQSGGGGAPTNVNYLVGTANPTLSNEIVVGTTPGGDLGGTWASPTIRNGVITYPKLSTYNTPTEGMVLTHHTYYGMIWATPVSGEGSNGKVAYWNTSKVLSYDADYGYNATTNTLTVGGGSGNGSVTSGNFILSSDRRLKAAIQPINNIDWVDDIHFKSFYMKNDLTGRLRFGVVAQEVEKVNPNLVYTDENGFKAVGYTDLLVAKVARQDEIIKELIKRIEKLENEK